MVLAEEQDKERLRTAALLLEAENTFLVKKNLELQKKVLQLEHRTPEELQLHLAELERQLAANNKKLFGSTSERRPRPKDKPKQPKEPQTGHGPRPQPDLPIVPVPCDLAPEDLGCTVCGGEMEKMEGQFEESELIDVIERKFVLGKVRRQKYRCRCNAHVETAPGPLMLVEGGRYSIDFAIDVAVSKYADHLPLERQVKIMAREGLVIDSQTLWDQLDLLATHLDPVHEALRVRGVGSAVVGADETTWRLMGKKNKRCYVWSLRAPDAVYFTISESRSHEPAVEMLKGFVGTAVVDGYSVYPLVAKLRPEGMKFILANCWAHARRKFIEVEKHFPKESGEVLDLIGKLYAVEDKAPSGREGDEQRAKLRAEESKSITNEIQAWAFATRAKHLPQSGLRQAIEYMLNLWLGLLVYLTNPQVPLDNNGTEQSERGIAVGRKNHYGSRSTRGMKVAGLFYSIIETCKVVGLDPRVYLRRAIESALAKKRIPLPHEVAAERRAQAATAEAPGG